MPTTRRNTAAKQRQTSAMDSPQAQAQPQAPNDKYAPTVWGNAGLGLQDFEVPSGQMCLVRRSGVLDLMKIGVLHSTDTLSALVDEKHIRRVKGKPADVDVESFLSDEDAVKRTMHTVDRVVTTCVVQPKVFMTPDDVTNRKQGVVYCDMIDVLDRMAIFNFVVNGVRDLEPFRSGSDEAVDGVEDESDVSHETE